MNRALEEKQQSARVTHLSHAALGLDEQPTVHEGSQAQSLALHGIKADRCELNRQIHADNKLLRELKAQLAKLSKVVENTVEHIAETLERLRSSLPTGNPSRSSCKPAAALCLLCKLFSAASLPSRSPR